MNAPFKFIRFFDEIGSDDVQLVGGKNAALGEMYQHLTHQGVHIPNGFAITAKAYRLLLDSVDAWSQLHDCLDGINTTDMNDFRKRAQKARDTVLSIPLPQSLKDEISMGYRKLLEEYGPELSVAVRSSATAEDLPTASFAGQQETFLNIQGEDQLFDACKHCFASLFTDRAIHYRIDNNFDHFSIGLSIGIMKMVRSDKATSGVMFSIDTETGFENVILISASYGLGENIVQGIIDPDEFYIFKPTFNAGYKQVLRRKLGTKKLKMVYDTHELGHSTINIETSDAERDRYCISDDEILKLGDYALKIEQHFTSKAGKPTPMDMEWAKDSTDGKIYMLQARPETVESRSQHQIIEQYQLSGTGRVLLSGPAIGSRIGTGTVRVIPSPEDINKFKPGEVLVTDTTTPDWEPIMKQAAAIITNRGGRTCHAAIVARELGIPAIIGTGDATERIHTGESVTVACHQGELGQVYEGAIPFEVKQTDIGHLPKTKTKIMLIIGNPEIAFRNSFLPNDGVGLARMEFIINEYVKAHPMALLHPEKVTDRVDRATLDHLTRHYPNRADYFIEKLSEGIAMLAAAFYPKPVIVRMSDFKSNEYASLIGGSSFEPDEENPMIGFRGASRYSHPAYTEAFALECAAIKRSRESLGLTNIKVMIPFCRRLSEAQRTIETMSKYGLKRGENGLEIYVMCEIPNNVLLIDEFAKHFDGFSIGSNDLTQLTLGVDRDSELVAFDFDERDEGMKLMLKMAVEGCQRNHRHSGICGQAPSDYPEIAEYLVKLGIDSISLNPDSVVPTLTKIASLEQQLSHRSIVKYSGFGR